MRTDGDSGDSPLSPDGHLVLEEDPMVWIRKNPTRLLSVRRLELYCERGLGGEGIIGDSIGQLTELTHLSFLHVETISCLPNILTTLPNLQMLKLYECHELQELPPNLGDLESLTSLSIMACPSIKALPDSLAKLSKLSKLDISDCENLEELPANFGELGSLAHFTLQNCRRIKSLPSSVAKLSKLTTFDIRSYSDLPLNLGVLKSLTHLRIDCRFLNELPANLGKLPQLSVLDIQDTRIKCLPSSITKLSKLRLLLLPNGFIVETLPYQLDESLVISVQDTHARKTWKELKKEMEIFSSPVRVDPSGYLRLTGDPTPWILNNYTSHWMVRILDLKFYDSEPIKLDSIANLTELTHLHITDGMLTRLPLQLTRVTHLSLYNCELKFDMESSLDSLGKLFALESLHITSCDSEFLHQMDLPVSLRQLTLCLRKHHATVDSRIRLYLGNDLAPLLDRMTKLSNLQALHLFGEDIGGAQFDSLPESLNLKKLKLVDCYIKSLPRGLRHVEILHSKGLISHFGNEFENCFNQLVDVETLSVTCHCIKSLPSITALHNLKELNLKDCFSLKKLPPHLDGMVNLCTLNVSGTRIKSLPCSISKLPKLQCLILPKCFQRRSLPPEFNIQSMVSFDETDEKYYKDMGYYDSDLETSSEDDDDTTNTIEGVNKVVLEESGGGIISQQDKSPHQLLNEPDPFPVLGGVMQTIQLANRHHTFFSYQNQEAEIFPFESKQSTGDNRLLNLQKPCFPSSQHALQPEHMASMTSEFEHGLPPNLEHNFSRSTGNYLLVSDNGQNEDNLHREGDYAKGQEKRKEATREAIVSLVPENITLVAAANELKGEEYSLGDF